VPHRRPHAAATPTTHGTQRKIRLRPRLTTPPLQAEAEPNSGTGNATAVTLTTSGSGRSGSVAGYVQTPGDLDYFNLGTVSAGETIFLTTRKPGTSNLDPVVAVYNAANGYTVESGAVHHDRSGHPDHAGTGRPSDGAAQVNATQTGTYFAVMRSLTGPGALLPQSPLDVNIVPPGSVAFPNPQVTGTPPPAGTPQSG